MSLRLERGPKSEVTFDNLILKRESCPDIVRNQVPCNSSTGTRDVIAWYVANGIVREAVEGGCSHIAFEDLTGIRERMAGAKRLHAWAFRRLYAYVAYKAEDRGIKVEQVDPRYTSRRCSRTDCGFTHPGNRPSQESFCCRECGYEVHADYNAAKNVGFRFLRSLHTSSGGDAPVGVRVNTGTVNTSGFIPAPDSVRVGVHGGSPALLGRGSLLA